MLAWKCKETGGPKVEAPRWQGFGRSLTERVLAADLGASGTLGFLPEGVNVALIAPMSVSLRA